MPNNDKNIATHRVQEILVAHNTCQEARPHPCHAVEPQILQKSSPSYRLCSRKEDTVPPATLG